MKSLFITTLFIFMISSAFAQQSGFIIQPEPTKPEQTEFYEPKVPRVIPGTTNSAPGDAIVLFDGKNFNEWISSKDSTAVKWTLNKDGSFTVLPRTGDIQTKRNFGDVQLHIEWKSPEKIEHEGQGRGNSGVFLQNRYEVQVLDNNNNSTYL
jgi:hypothetical protein